jgi:hypothetical protein
VNTATVFVVALLLWAGPVSAQTPAAPPTSDRTRLTVHATRLRAPLRLDGRIDEEVYTLVPPISTFIQSEPREGEPATEPTEAWVLFDDDKLYVSAKCYDSQPARWVLNEMRRDIPAVSNNESFGVSLDTFHDQRNGFIFEVNALGGFLDGQITNEGFPPNTDWNPVWNTRVSRFDGGWSFEMEIPFRSLRYGPGDSQVWGINMRRTVRWKNEESHIVPVPRSLGMKRGLMQLSLAATLDGLQVPAGSRNLEIKPYGISTLSSDRAATPALSNDLAAKGGLDIKYGLTQNLTADFTINTDFAQVEVDTQQVNLTRFSLFFPEKRAFFLEGQGIFNFGVGAGANTGGADMPTLFFSRRIGLSGSQAVPIDAGTRLTGKVGRFTVGGLNIQTDDKPEAAAVATNFAAFRIKRDVLRRSSVGVLYTGRSRSLVTDGRNETYGVDGAFSFGNDLNINTFIAKTRTERAASGHDLSYRGEFNYAGDRYGLRVERLVIEERFNPEVGFVRRPDMRKLTGTARFSPRPRNSRTIRKYTWEATGTAIDNHTGQLESREWSGTFGIDFQNSDQLRVVAASTFEFVPRPFRLAGGPLVPIGEYDFATATIRYTLGQQHRLGGTASLDVGSFYDGHKTTAALSGGRVQLSPHLSVEPGVSINWVDLPFGTFTTSLLQTRLIYTVTPRLFVTGLVQSNSISDLVSTNLRLRWEYLPGSELFVVYTDERDAASRGFPEQVNRALVVKIAPMVRF